MNSSNLRIGQGIDVHEFAEGRKLFLGGVEVPAARGLLGHSDADVLLHAITDAVLGALSWGDIGQWFPNTDPKWKDASSVKLFEAVWAKASGEGWKLINCDCSVLAETPKLMPHMQKIRENIAGLFKSAVDQISVKATTTEKLGFVGREEGMVALATVLLIK